MTAKFADYLDHIVTTNEARSVEAYTVGPDTIYIIEADPAHWEQWANVTDAAAALENGDVDYLPSDGLHYAMVDGYPDKWGSGPTKGEAVAEVSRASDEEMAEAGIALD